MENNLSRLRKKAFGGFNRQDVVSYIERVKNESYTEKLRLENKIRELNLKIEELEQESVKTAKEKEELARMAQELNEQILSKIDESEDPVSEINQATNHLKSVADELCSSLRDFIDRISENSYSVVLEQKDEEKDFDGEKFMAELEAELYSKLGFDEKNGVTQAAEESLEEAAEETVEEAAEEICTQAEDKVSAILSFASGFTSDKAETPEETKASSAVSDILGTLSFLK